MVYNLTMKIDVTLMVIARSPVLSVLLYKRPEDNLYSLPHSELSGKATAFAVAAYKLYEYTSLLVAKDAIGYTILVQKNIIDEPDRIEYGERCVAVPLVCYLPEVVGLNYTHKAEWQPLYNLVKLPMYLDHLNIINSVLLKG
jgi:hypothetical protein